MQELPALDENGNDPQDAMTRWWAERNIRPQASVRCNQQNKSGGRCKKWAIRGLDKCIKHGDIKFSPTMEKYRNAVMHQARMEILRMAPAALSRIEKLVDDPEVPAAVQLRASEAILDRAGIRGGIEVDVTTDDGVRGAAEVLADKLEEIAARQSAAQTRAHEREQQPQLSIIEGTVVEEEEEGAGEDADEQLSLFEEVPGGS